MKLYVWVEIDDCLVCFDVVGEDEYVVFYLCVGIEDVCGD